MIPDSEASLVCPVKRDQLVSQLRDRTVLRDSLVYQETKDLAVLPVLPANPVSMVCL